MCLPPAQTALECACSAGMHTLCASLMDSVNHNGLADLLEPPVVTKLCLGVLTMLGPATKVTTWVLWNAGTVCKPLCQALSSSAQQAADVAQRVLSGTLEALQRGSAAGHSDPRTQ